MSNYTLILSVRVIFRGIFILFYVSSLYFEGIFNNPIIPFALVGVLIMLNRLINSKLNIGLFQDQGPVSRKPRKLFGPVKPLQNLKPCDCRAVLFTYSKDEWRFPSYKKFQAYTLLRF